MVQGELNAENAEKLTCTAVRLADGGIRNLISLLTSQGQAGDFTRL